MLIFVLLIVLIAFVDMKPAARNEIFPDYMSKSQTTAINGIFTLLVFISHVSSYFELDGVLDGPYAVMKSYLRQMVVVSFLFYSGYGMMESIKNKSMTYIKSIPTKRFFKVLYHFWIAVALYVLTNIYLGRKLNLKNTLLAFTGWTGIGNSNWYVVAVLSLYLITFISFFVSRGNKYAGVILTCVLTCALAVLFKETGVDTWWYNTLVLFPCGMIFSLGKDLFDRVIKKGDGWWFAVLALFFAVYAVFQPLRDKRLAYYYIWGIMFMMLVVMLTTKLKIGNNILSFIGSHVFSIYILQRIPMMLLSNAGYAKQHKYMFVVYSFIITLVLAYAYDFVIAKLDRLIYNRKKEQ